MATIHRDYLMTLKPSIDAEAFEEAGRLAARLFLTAYAGAILNALSETDDAVPDDEPGDH